MNSTNNLATKAKQSHILKHEKLVQPKDILNKLENDNPQNLKPEISTTKSNISECSKLVHRRSIETTTIYGESFEKKFPLIKDTVETETQNLNFRYNQEQYNDVDEDSETDYEIIEQIVFNYKLDSYTKSMLHSQLAYLGILCWLIVMNEILGPNICWTTIAIFLALVVSFTL